MQKIAKQISRALCTDDELFYFTIFFAPLSTNLREMVVAVNNSECVLVSEIQNKCKRAKVRREKYIWVSGSIGWKLCSKKHNLAPASISIRLTGERIFMLTLAFIVWIVLDAVELFQARIILW